jgi:hypothetical protein
LLIFSSTRTGTASHLPLPPPPPPLLLLPVPTASRRYLRTIDIAHDHFGFYLAWGDVVWLPFMSVPAPAHAPLSVT